MRGQLSALELSTLQELPDLCVRASDGTPSDNLLIRGDCLAALRALERDLAGRVRCVFIDPPYNTGGAFAHYADAVGHAQWLAFMRDRVALLRALLTGDGSLWIAVDDRESHYLKVLCDSLFGRACFVANVVWQKKYTVANDVRWLSNNHDHLLVYCKDPTRWAPRKLPRTEAMDARYRNPDGDPRGPWKSTPLHARSGTEASGRFEYTFRNGAVWAPPPGTFARYSRATLDRLDREGELWFGADGRATPARKTFLGDVRGGGVPAPTVWTHDEVGHNHEAKEEVRAFNPGDVFSTPKPERLIHRVLHLATDPGDLVLDAFAGSGTTGAVAHKMGRRWVMVELGDHCDTHIVPRLRRVIEDADPGGVTAITGWKGGGGYRYLRAEPDAARDAMSDTGPGEAPRPSPLLNVSETLPLMENGSPGDRRRGHAPDFSPFEGEDLMKTPSRHPEAHGALGKPATLSAAPVEEASDSWASVEAEVDAVPAHEATSPRVDLQAAAETALTVCNDVCNDKALRARFVAMAGTGEYDGAALAKVRRYAGACWYARHRQLEAEASQRYEVVPEALVTKGAELLGRMLKLSQYHFGEHPEEGPLVASLNASPGHRKLANHLLALAELYARHPAVVAADPRNYRPTDERDARAVAADIVKALSDGGTRAVELWTGRCARAWTLLSRAYDEVQSLGQYLLRATPDAADERFPSLVTGAREVTQPRKAAAPVVPTPPAAGAAPVATPPVAAKPKRKRRRTR